jgi:hypothetical protein
VALLLSLSAARIDTFSPAQLARLAQGLAALRYRCAVRPLAGWCGPGACSQSPAPAPASWLRPPSPTPSPTASSPFRLDL